MSRDRQELAFLLFWNVQSDDNTKHSVKEDGVFDYSVVSELPVSSHGSGSNSPVDVVAFFRFLFGSNTENTLFDSHFDILTTEPCKSNLQFLRMFIDFDNVVRGIVYVRSISKSIKSAEHVLKTDANGRITLPTSKIVHLNS